MTQHSMTAATTVEDDSAPLMAMLNAYGYLLSRPNGYRWLAGYLRGSQLQHARSVIEARYAPRLPTGNTTPLTLVEQPQKRQAVAA